MSLSGRLLTQSGSNNMLKLREETRDEIVKVIANSVLPTNLGIQVINILNGLEKIEEKSNEKPKEK